jgi:hypothetical protein
MKFRFIHKILAFAAFLTITLFISFQAGADIDKKYEIEAQQRKEEIYKKYNVEIANRDEYPITMLTHEQVPLPQRDFDPFRWVDSDTLIYVKDIEMTPEERRVHTRLNHNFPIITVNLKTLQMNEVSPKGALFCFDTETQNIVYSMAPDTDGGRVIGYGTFGKELKKYKFFPKEDIRESYYPYSINKYDCTLYPVPVVKGEERLREGDGSVGRELDPANTPWDKKGVYIIKKPDGSQKRVAFGDSNVIAFHYDYFSKRYWKKETSAETTEGEISHVWWFDRNFSLISEEKYGPGSGLGMGSELWYAVKPGFLIEWRGSYRSEDKKKFLRYGGLYLILRDNRRIELFDGSVQNISVSPNGCRAVFVYNSSEKTLPLPTRDHAYMNVGIVDICKS